MLTIEDCLALCDLTEDEVMAIAEHEHIPEIVAAELGYYLVHAPGGIPRIKSIIRDDIAAAESHGDKDRVLRLKLVLWHFIQMHNDAGPVAASGGARRA